MEPIGWSRELPVLPDLPEDPEELRNFDVAAAVEVYDYLDDVDEAEQGEPHPNRRLNAINALNQYLRIDGQDEDHFFINHNPYRERKPLREFFERIVHWPADPHEAACLVYERLQEVVDKRERMIVVEFRREVLRLRDLAIRLESLPEPHVMSIRKLPYMRTGNTVLLVRAGQFEVYVQWDAAEETTRPVDYGFAEESDVYRIPPGCTNNYAFWTADDVRNWLDFFDLDDDVKQIFEGMDGLRLFYKLHTGAMLGPRHNRWSPDFHDLVIINFEWEPVVPQPAYKMLQDHMNKLHNLLVGGNPL